MRRDIMIQCLWFQQVKAILDVKLGDVDMGSYKYEPMAEVMDWWETIKKYKHGKHCNDQWNHFHHWSFEYMEF